MKIRLLAGAALLLGAVGFIGLISLNTGCAPGIARAQPKLDEKLLTRGAFQVDDGQLHYVATGSAQGPLVVFVHGTPGSWRAFEHLLQDPELQDALHMVAVDRLGFGASAAAGPAPSFATQAQAISTVFALNESPQKALVVGHSLGGSIAYRLAIDYPQHVGALLAISSAIDPRLSTPRWYNRLAALPVVRWLVPDSLSRANVEMMPLHTELSAVEPQLPRVTIPVTVMQGDKDTLVEAANIDFAQRQLTGSNLRALRYPDAGHFLIWEQPELVKAEILRLATLLR